MFVTRGSYFNLSNLYIFLIYILIYAFVLTSLILLTFIFSEGRRVLRSLLFPMIIIGDHP